MSVKKTEHSGSVTVSRMQGASREEVHYGGEAVSIEISHFLLR